MIFDESQSVERTIGLGGKSFEIVEMDELFYNISKLTIWVCIVRVYTTMIFQIPFFYFFSFFFFID